MLNTVWVRVYICAINTFRCKYMGGSLCTVTTNVGRITLRQLHLTFLVQLTPRIGCIIGYYFSCNLIRPAAQPWLHCHMKLSVSMVHSSL